MLIFEYDKVVDYIEENITLEKKEIKSKVNQMLGMTDRRAGEFFLAIDSEGRTVKQYIRDRKVFRALEDFVAGETAEAVAEKYDLSDPAAFSTSVRALTGSSPKILRQEKYVCPRPKHLNELLSEDKGMNKSLNENTDIEKYIIEINNLIDENESLKSRVSTLIKREIESREKSSSVNDPNNISLSSYERFLEVENCRVSYGFSVEHILKLYEESISMGIGLEELCEEALYSFRFEFEDKDTSDHDIERLGYQLEYEMDSGESFDYYCGDDDIADMEKDPFAGDYDAKAEHDISDAELQEYSECNEEEEDNDQDAPDPKELGIEVNDDMLDEDGNPLEFA